jgi:aspartate kinase
MYLSSKIIGLILMNNSVNIEVLKFGGTSQKKSTYEMIFNMINDKNNVKFIVVLSAIKGITNKLLDFTESKNFSHWNTILEINNELSIETLNYENEFIASMKNKLWNLESDKVEIVSMGEFFTTNVLNDYLKQNGIKSKFISSYDVIKSNMNNNGNMYNKGEFTVNHEIIFEAFKDNQVVVIPGFSGSSLDGYPCLLGRGGSDTTGSIIAAAVNASKYEIWTDVNGIYSCDPRIVKDAYIIKNIGYTASQEIAAMGAKVIHPYCILPCAQKNIPIIIKNTFQPNTKVNTEISNNNVGEDIYGITIQNNVKVFKITSMNMWNNFGFVYDIFSVFKKYNVDVNIINTSQFNITTTTEETNIENLMHVKNELEKKYNVELTFDISIISVIGEKIRTYNNIGDLFNLTKNYPIILTSYSSNDMTLSWVIETNLSNKLIISLHDLISNKIKDNTMILNYLDLINSLENQ